jgi:two-component system, cell cycle sensor histidine kinase and response regulator CckA
MRPQQSTEDSESFTGVQEVTPGGDLWQHVAERYRTILEALPSAVTLIAKHQPIYCNRAFCDVFGYSEQEALRQPTLTYFADPLAFERVASESAPIIAAGATYRAELVMTRKGGACFWASVTGRGVRLDRPENAALWVLEDITERRQTEEELRSSELRLEAAQAQALIGSWELGPELDSHYWSQQMYSLFGFEPNLGVPSVERYFQRLHPEDLHALLHAHYGAVETKKPCRLVYRSHPNLGSIRHFEVTIVPCVDEQGHITKITGTTQDVTDRMKLQAQLQQTSKMEAIGRLAGGVAHDFNNLLSVTSGNVELAQEMLAEDDPAGPYLSEVLEAASSAASLTRQLLAFSRRQLVEPRVLNLNAIVEQLHKLLQRLIGEDITLEMVLDEHLGAVKIDPGQFDQVIINLVVNARDAMPHGGRLALETANVDLGEEYCRTHNGELHPGSFVMLAVSDTGEGIDPEVRSHIFEPFFTTKAQGKGTGLGLAVIFGVVKQAGGVIEAYSEVGHGTTFKIYLPRVDEPAVPLSKGSFAEGVYEGTETILLVEDNDAVRELTAQMLRRLGYELIVAESGQRALALVNQQNAGIDLLLTDLIMPGLSGRELAERICALYPSIGILYCSGYTEDTFVRLGLAAEQLEFLSKPFTMHQLGRKVRQVLDTRKASQ